MKLTKHDQDILDEMEARFERETGQKATHIFIDTKETINDGSEDKNIVDVINGDLE